MQYIDIDFDFVVYAMEYFISFSSRYPTSDCVRLTLWLFENNRIETPVAGS